MVKEEPVLGDPVAHGHQPHVGHQALDSAARRLAHRRIAIIGCSIVHTHHSHVCTAVGGNHLHLVIGCHHRQAVGRTLQCIKAGVAPG